jgi:hypothetical protein
MAAKDEKQPITPEMLEMMKTLKSIFVDEEDEARKKEEREQRAKERAAKELQNAIDRETEQQRMAAKKAIQESCLHQREDNTYNLHGQRGCDGQVRFMCPLCLAQFVPGHPQYNDLIRRVSSERLGNARQV